MGILKQHVEHYRNQWMVQIPAGLEAAKKIAENEGFILERELEEFPNLFKFSHPKHLDEGKYENKYLTDILKGYKEVIWAQQLASVKRETRRVNTHMKENFISHIFNMEIDSRQMRCPLTENRESVSIYDGYCSDPYFSGQWYMHDCRKKGTHNPYNYINVVRVWEEFKIFGEGIVVLIIDDGFETKHYDLRNNYKEFYGYDFVDEDDDPNPVHNEKRIYNHGTKTGGVVGMLKNNGYCGVGVAPEVTLGAIRLIGPKPSNDEKDGAALLFRNGNVDIVNNSWGPQDNGITVQNLGEVTRAALKTGVTTGRRNKGTIYIFAGGNGKREGDMCGCDAFVNSLYTITVASIDYKGSLTWFSERCAAVMVTAYSGDKSTIFNVISTDVGINKCTTEHSGTSASAPMVTGGVALALQIRPDLTWRDVQFLIILTSKISIFLWNKLIKGLTRNKAGLYYSSDIGFGVIDVYDLVKTAKTFTLVPPMSSCVAEVIKSGSAVSFSRGLGLKIEATITACAGHPAEINYIEHVQVFTTISYTKRGDIQIKLQSALGSSVRLLEPRSHDSSTDGFTEWTFDSLHAWAENPRGKWTILVFDNTGTWTNYGKISELKLVIHGTKNMPDCYKNLQSFEINKEIPA
ncbi:hypothetical protein PGB90_002435 [Kerria lacca]